MMYRNLLYYYRYLLVALIVLSINMANYYWCLRDMITQKNKLLENIAEIQAIESKKQIQSRQRLNQEKIMQEEKGNSLSFQQRVLLKIKAHLSASGLILKKLLFNPSLQTSNVATEVINFEAAGTLSQVRQFFLLLNNQSEFKIENFTLQTEDSQVLKLRLQATVFDIELPSKLSLMKAKQEEMTDLFCTDSKILLSNKILSINDIPLQQIVFVGYAEDKVNAYALFKLPDHTMHRLPKGGCIGKEGAYIAKIERDHVHLRLAHQDIILKLEI